MSDAYRQLISRKLALTVPTGLSAFPALPDGMFPHQEALTSWALRRGRCAIFADTGLGKTRMQVVWAWIVHLVTGLDVMILAPLAVASQTVAEARLIGIEVTLCRSAADVRHGVNITNYDRLHRFDTARFGGVVLDESSCIKHHESKTLQLLMDAFASTPYKLCATATPAPNDWTELGTHAEFLGICKRMEMLAEFFVHDGGDTQTWRLKGHARSQFWRWIASWGAMIRSPADLGFDASAYELPPLTVHEHTVKAAHADNGMLFQMEALTLSERRAARKASIDKRVASCAEVVSSEPHEPWIVWTDLNAESEALTSAIKGSVQVTGSDDIDVKELRLIDFASGRTRIIVSKPSICGFGCNWQHSARMAFVGVTDSYESYYQAIRRIWRFGQRRPVHVHVFASEAEGAVVANLRRKERDAAEMARQLSAETMSAVRAEVVGTSRHSNEYNAARRVLAPRWLASETA